MNLRDSIVPNFLVRASGGLPRPVQGWFRAPQAGEVKGRCGQRELHRDLRQAPTPELSHAALFFQDSEHRFHDLLSQGVSGATSDGAQFALHSVFHRCSVWDAPPRTRRQWLIAFVFLRSDVGVDLFFVQGLDVLFAEVSCVS